MSYASFNVRSVKYTAVSATADGDNTIISAPGAGLRILVLGYQLRFSGAGAYTVKSGASGTTHLVETGVASPGTRLSYAGNDQDTGAFLCDVNSALVVNNVASGDTLGHITYRIVPANYA